MIDDDFPAILAVVAFTPCERAFSGLPTMFGLSLRERRDRAEAALLRLNYRAYRVLEVNDAAKRLNPADVMLDARTREDFQEIRKATWDYLKQLEIVGSDPGPALRFVSLVERAVNDFYGGICAGRSAFARWKEQSR
ncbi:hypothetical protein [Azospirillum rugosum]|uniref:Uncharacterized protein n=1 Tax=Azospirillum rugosum TaxID=416170 RepID=A0ABS4SH51_9PROT|nr:hypothetical protein [Azospirillum rugosum]MBP2290755.1 hypothetical protein [Azospirillum rugosum]MDQ0525644.1 hypothetical protein [Azospirillum rugosum]